MTCKEKFEKEFPRYDYKDYCPDEFHYVEIPEYCHEYATREDCDRCWNREISEEEDDVAFRQPDETVPATPTKSSGYVTVTFPTSKPTTPAKENDISRVKNPNTPTIKDSGDRTEFATGAVRDMREGKGRCDLIPLEVVRDFLEDEFVGYIANFLNDSDADELYEALGTFAERAFADEYTMLLEVAKHFEEGAKKYGDNNWQKGIPVYCYIDSALRHYFKWLRGDVDEPHDRAVCWNLMCCIWEVEYHNYGESEGVNV